MSTPADHAPSSAWVVPIYPGHALTADAPSLGGDRWEALKTARESVAAEVLALVPRDLAMRHSLLPLERTGDLLRVAVSDVSQTDGVDSLAHVTGLHIEPVAFPADELVGLLERCYGKPEWAIADLEGGTADAVREPAEPAAERLEAAESDAPIIRIVHSLIERAVQRRASDIHVEPLERRLRVRYRIDGVLWEVESPPKRLQNAVISRLKIMANISIAEKRVPQDGRIQLKVTGRPLDLRVSSLPTAFGESVVMRILDQAGVTLGLAQLGLAPDDQCKIEELIARPNGMVLVTGPTGSGKTTTLYSCLHHLNRADRKIITVEDPVEYQLTGVNQVPVRHDIGMTFAAALRAMLRQAPNAIMVGEIRDAETAEIAIHASLTGHLVFSTLHTNDAVGAVTRLLDLGVKPFLVAASLHGVVAQRLVRKTCEKCRRSHGASAAELEVLQLPSSVPAPLTVFRGQGCGACDRSGYRGRLGVFEVLVVDDALRRLVHERASVAALRRCARAGGLRTMREDGVHKVIAGLTTVEEVVSITLADSLPQ